MATIIPLDYDYISDHAQNLTYVVFLAFLQRGFGRDRRDTIHSTPLAIVRAPTAHQACRVAQKHLTLSKSSQQAGLHHVNTVLAARYVSTLSDLSDHEAMVYVDPENTDDVRREFDSHGALKDLRVFGYVGHLREIAAFRDIKPVGVAQ